MSYLKNTTGQYLYFAFVSATDGSAVTTGTPSGYRSIDGGAQGAVTGTISHKGNGQWELAMSQADTNGDEIGFLFTVSGAIPVSINIVTDTKKVGDLADLDAAGIRTAVGLSTANLDTQLADIPTVAEFEARTLLAASYFDPSTDAVDVGSISGDSVAADNLEAMLDGTGGVDLDLAHLNIIATTGSALTVQNGDASNPTVDIQNTTANGDAVKIAVANPGSGDALLIQGGSSGLGSGINVASGAVGVRVTGGTGIDVYGTTGRGMTLQAEGTGAALYLYGGRFDGSEGVVHFDDSYGVPAILMNGGNATYQTLVIKNNNVSGDVFGPDLADAIQQEATDALNAYDPPTNAELEARTLLAASYFDPSTDAVDVGSISGDSVAADNLEAMLDGTGGVDLDLAHLNLTSGDADPALSVVNNGATGKAAYIYAAATVALDIASDSPSLPTMQVTNNDLGGAIRLSALSASPAVSVSNFGNGEAIEAVAAGSSPAVNIEHTGGGTALSVVANSTSPAMQINNGAAGGMGFYVSSYGAAMALSGAADLILIGSGDISGNLNGNVTGTIGGLTAAALADFFNTNSGDTYAGAVAGSVVKEIADNAGGSGLTLADIADAVWDEAITGHLSAGSTGLALNSAGTAGDPWSTALPGAYGAGTAGYIVGTNLPRLTFTDDGTADKLQVDVRMVTGSTTRGGDLADICSYYNSNGGFMATAVNNTVRGEIATNVWDALLPGPYTAGMAGYILGTNLDQAISDPVDVGSISGDSTAADNLEAVLDGTGASLTLDKLRISADDPDGAIHITNASASGHGVNIQVTSSGQALRVRNTLAAGYGAMFYGGLAGILSNGDNYGVVVNGTIADIFLQGAYGGGEGISAGSGNNAIVGDIIGSVDIRSISGDSVAADNLEAMLDGTGGVDLDLAHLNIVSTDAAPTVLIENQNVAGWQALSVKAAAAGGGTAIKIEGGTASGGIGVSVDAYNGIVCNAINGKGLQVYSGGGDAVWLSSDGGSALSILGLHTSPAVLISNANITSGSAGVQVYTQNGPGVSISASGNHYGLDVTSSLGKAVNIYGGNGGVLVTGDSTSVITVTGLAQTALKMTTGSAINPTVDIQNTTANGNVINVVANPAGNGDALRLFGGEATGGIGLSASGYRGGQFLGVAFGLNIATDGSGSGPAIWLQNSNSNQAVIRMTNETGALDTGAVIQLENWSGLGSVVDFYSSGGEVFSQSWPTTQPDIFDANFLDALRAATWDALIADHRTADTTGDALYDASQGGGSSGWAPIIGSEFVSYRVTRTDNGEPIEGASVWIANDMAFADIVWVGVTNQNGEARYPIDNSMPQLDVGTYYVRVQKGGFSFPLYELMEVTLP